MSLLPRLRDESGFALLLVLLITLSIGAIAMASVAVLGNARLINHAAARQAEMQDAALSGLELGRALANADPTLYPDSGFREIPSDSLPLKDAWGQPIAGLTRHVYVGPVGVASGQYGVFGTVLSVVEDHAGNRTVWRQELSQESFAKYAYFTDKETDDQNNPIYFVDGDQLFGPVHSNDVIHVLAGGGGPVFHGPVTTHRTVDGKRYASFQQGVQEHTGRIELPNVAELGRLKEQAELGNASIIGDNAGGPGEATTRIEFVGIDVNGDGDTTDPDEGFFKVYQSSDARWVSAGRIPYQAGGTHCTGPWWNRVCTAQDEVLPAQNPNCGHPHSDGKFYTMAVADGGSAYEQDTDNVLSVMQGVKGSRARCYLGGADSLAADQQFHAADGVGQWLAWGGSWATSMPSAISSRPDAAYLWPLSHSYNPGFKGVIYVAGKAVVSGEVRGRLTLATSGNIIIGDDVLYATDPSAGGCDDILGLFSGGDIVVADNALNAPMDPNDDNGKNFRTYDDTSDEVIQAVLLTLGSFTAENYDSGATKTERCQGELVGRGCLYVTGGIIQKQRGPVGQQAGFGPGATGYLKRYSYDQCAASHPPPYFPTTGYFVRGRESELNPVNFDVASYFERVTAG